MLRLITALMAAIANDRTATAAALISLGADVNARAADGMTALILAAGNGQVAVTELLLRSGADPNAKDATGGTSLMIASERGYIDAVRVLLVGKADVHASDARGNKALMHAAFFGRPETASVLIDAGAAINARNNEGWTPLMSAAFKGHGEVVRLLIGRGADIEIKNNSGLTAAVIAGRRGDEATFGILKKAGAKETFDFTQKEALVVGKLIFVEDGKEVNSYSIFDRPTPELFHAETGKTINRIQLAGLLKEAVNENGSFCWKIPRGSYMFNRINRFGAPREDHFVYPQAAFLVPYGADAYYLGTLKIRIAVKRNFIGEKSVGKVLSVEVVDESGGSRQLLTSGMPDFSGTTETNLMVHSTSLPTTVRTGASDYEKLFQILNAFTIPLMMIK